MLAGCASVPLADAAKPSETVAIAAAAAEAAAAQAMGIGGGDRNL
jgi:hypothetical protein